MERPEGVENPDGWYTHATMLEYGMVMPLVRLLSSPKVSDWTHAFESSSSVSLLAQRKQAFHFHLFTFRLVL